MDTTNQVEAVKAKPVKKLRGRKKGSKNVMTTAFEILGRASFVPTTLHERQMVLEAAELKKQLEVVKKELAILQKDVFLYKDLCENLEKTSTEAEKYMIKENEELKNNVANLQIENAQLYHQIIGYKAVISYLEVQAGLKETQA